MKNLLKKIILISILFSGIVNCACAQDKYEYGVVGYTLETGNKYMITNSLSSLNTEETGHLEKENFWTNFSPVNKVLSDLSNKGWEVYGVEYQITTSSGTHNYYFLKRKL